MWLSQLAGENGFKSETISQDKIFYYIDQEPELEIIEKRLIKIAISETLDEKITMPRTRASRVAQRYLHDGPGSLEIINTKQCMQCGALVTLNSQSAFHGKCKTVEIKHDFVHVEGSEMPLCRWCGLQYRSRGKCNQSANTVLEHDWSLNTFRIVRSSVDTTANFSVSPYISSNAIIDRGSLCLNRSTCTLCTTPYE